MKNKEKKMLFLLCSPKRKENFFQHVHNTLSKALDNYFKEGGEWREFKRLCLQF
jgi:hypothetical protein